MYKAIYNELLNLTDEIVIESLKIVYNQNKDPDRIDCSDCVIDPDLDFLCAIETVLAYYMLKPDFDEWLRVRN